MYTASSNSMVKETLKNLSCNNGWSYAVFWRFDQRNSSLLTLQGAYYEENMGVLVDDMILQIHSLGEGVIGQVAFSKRHKWMMAESAEFSDIFQDQQFSNGIKTIAVISVEPLGVVQFGSTEKVLETLEFVNQTKELFQGIEIIEGLIFPESEQSSSTTDDNCGTSGLFTSLLSSMNPYSATPNLQLGDDCNYSLELNFSAENITQSFPSGSDFQNMICGNHFRNIVNTESQGYSDILLQPSEMETCSHPWSFGVIEESSILNSGCSNGLFSQNFGSSFHPNTLDTFEELLGKHNSNNAISSNCAMEDVSHWFAPVTDQRNGIVSNAPSNDLSNASGVFSLSSSPKAYPTPRKIISDNQSSTTSVQSSITNPLEFAERERCVSMFGSGRLLEGSRMDLEATNKSGVSSSSSTLFSKLGLYQHYNNDCDDGDDHLSSTAKRRKLEKSSLMSSSNQGKYVPGSGSATIVLNKELNFESVSEVTRTLGARSCYGDSSSSIIDGNTTSYQEPPKMKKKRAKPGTKQKSKDRIQIAARLADLRELIPNGEKMSIDRLLHRTIKHLLFLQSITKHAENSKQFDQLKNGLFRKEKDSSSSNGVTWACEVGNETMFCPLIVEDLGIPGQMLIEIICEEQGFFLEIVDIIRGFGLTILKGTMEVRKTKLWAQFTVEAEEKQQQITRHEIFASLVQLLQLTGSTEVYKSSELANPINGGEEEEAAAAAAGPFNNFLPQPCLPLPVSFTNKSL